MEVGQYGCYNLAVVALGDVNRDGHDDVAFSAAGLVVKSQPQGGPHPSGIECQAEAAKGQAAVGRVYVHYGTSKGVKKKPDLVLAPTDRSVGGAYGISVASAGDFNADRFPDVIVGTSAFQTKKGLAQIYFGSAAGLDTTPAFTVPDPDLRGQFGAAVAGVGDVNGDGFSDVGVAAWEAGVVNIYFGGPKSPGSPSATLVDPQDGVGFGHAIGGAGDLNNDGFADLFVFGAKAEDNLFIVYGRSTGALSAKRVTTTLGLSRTFAGQAAARAIDLDGDGYSELQVSPRGGLKTFLFSGKNADRAPSVRVLTVPAATGG